MTQAPKILIIDESENNMNMLVDFLSDSYDVFIAKTAKMAVSVLEKNEIACIMLDIVMKKSDGYQLLERLRNDERYSNIPTIVTTDEKQADAEIRALEMGAWDFIAKPYDPKIIRFRVSNSIERSQPTAFNQLKYLAEFDVLTDIYNKSKFYDATRVMLNQNFDTTYAFVKIDIDRFSLVNSFYGNKEGDKLLKYIAGVIKESLCNIESCTYGRITSDIFAFCVRCDDAFVFDTNIKLLKERIKSYNTNFDIEPNFGVYIIENHSMAVDKMYDNANLAAKKNKGNGSIDYTIYNEEMGYEVKNEQLIANEMHNAVENEQFVVYFQPKYNIQANKPAGAEALVRWKHKTRGLVTPDVFIPIFEKNGFISRLDYYVWEKVCGYLRKWLDMGIQPQPISVNVSRVDLYNPHFVENICSLVEKYDIPPKLFNLELTETAYADNPAVMQETMSKLQKKGFVVMMDDFGSGYSALNILKDIEVDVLKIDMRFFSQTKILGRGEGIIASVVRMAKWLDIPVVAEGVEKEEQVGFLRKIGCEYVQGFYYSRPMSAPEYERLMNGDTYDVTDEVRKMLGAVHEPTDVFC